MTAERIVGSAAELVNEVGVELQGIQYFTLSATVDEGSGVPIGISDEVQPTYGLRVKVEGRELGVRLSVNLEWPAGQIIVDAAATYMTDEDVTVPPDTILDFANNVGIMALLPYLRQSVTDLSQKVFGESLLMPMVKRGELTFTHDDAE